MEKVTPSKTTVELGIELAVKNGKLTGLIVEGEARRVAEGDAGVGREARGRCLRRRDGDPNPLIALFRQCVACITDEAGRFRGSGFFVAPGQVVTCGHVVHGAVALRVQWQGQVAPVGEDCRGAAAGVGGGPGRGTRCRTWRSSR